MVSRFREKYNQRKLGERSHLKFEFPQQSGRSTIAIIPMLENCSISESKKSNLATYDLLGRSSNIFAYLGAKSRNFNLKFNITFHHVLEMYNLGEISDDSTFGFVRHYDLDNPEKQKEIFLMGDQNPAELNISYAAKHRKYYKDLAKLNAKGSILFDTFLNDFIKDIGKEQKQKGDNFNYDELVKDESSSLKEVDKIIDYIVFWINLVRASGMNNSINTTLGPPIVRLNHGILYNNIPCITESSTVRIMDEAGYDMQTMLPRRVEISMNLNEMRVGNFGEFSAGQIVDGDNNPGWESVIGENNIDPYNSGRFGEPE